MLNGSNLHYTSTIPSSLPTLIEQYLDESDDLSECYRFQPSLEGLVRAAALRPDHAVDRKTLVSVLLQQAKESDHVSQAVLENIEALGHEDVFTVTTGHQLCLYGGPMFFLYKIISAIKWCKALEKKGIRSVPVYWMASEDHDFEEINHVYVRGQRVEWKASASGAVGALRLDGIRAFHAALSSLLGDNYIALKELRELENIFSPERTLAAAVKDFVYRLFAGHGVVVIDAADARLKSLFTPWIRRELEQGFSGKAVTRRSEYLTKLGFPAQVTPREINLFWMEPGIRERLVREEDHFALADRSRQFSRAGMLGLLETNPEKFSPNVVLRPLYQEVVLPNLAYIGGPGELSYWLQLEEMFDEAGVFFPALLLRDMAVIVDEKTEKKAQQLGITYDALRQDRDALIRQLLRKQGTHEHLVEEKALRVSQLMNELKEALGEVDATLMQSAEAEQKRIANRFEALRKKVLRADKKLNETLTQRLDALYGSLYPTGAPQERVSNYLSLCPDTGQIIQALLEAQTEPFNETKVLKTA